MTPMGQAKGFACFLLRPRGLDGRLLTGAGVCRRLLTVARRALAHNRKKRELRGLELMLIESLDWSVHVDLAALQRAHASLAGGGAPEVDESRAVLRVLLGVVQAEQRRPAVDRPCAPCAQWLDSLVAQSGAESTPG